MFFTILLLLGMTNSFFGMEPIASLDNNPFMQKNDITYSFLNGQKDHYNQASIPSAPPCDNCLDNNVIFDLLKFKNVIPQDFKSNNGGNVQELLGRAIDEKNHANERAKIINIFNKLDGLYLSDELKKNIEKLCQTHVQAKIPLASEFMVESVTCVKLFYQEALPPKVKPWRMSDNLNSALKLISSEGPEIASLSLVSVIASSLFPVFYINLTIQAYCFFKGLLAHSSAKATYQCKCHSKENNTFKCAYRWIYIGVGLLLFMRTYAFFLPFFARK